MSCRARNWRDPRTVQDARLQFPPRGVWTFHLQDGLLRQRPDVAWFGHHLCIWIAQPFQNGHYAFIHSLIQPHKCLWSNHIRHCVYRDTELEACMQEPELFCLLKALNDKDPVSQNSLGLMGEEGTSQIIDQLPLEEKQQQKKKQWKVQSGVLTRWRTQY